MISSGYKLKIMPSLRDFKVFYKDNFLFIKTKENGLLNSRVGVVVSQKNSRLATKRNAIKRLIYRFFQENRTFLDRFSPPSDFLVIIVVAAFNLKEHKDALMQNLKNAISV